ncbi:MAG: hypothetical protein F6K62_25500 [Sphaerospermopsis sp. SIO1G2]|nr:hypothetical protein [Sphaerospermopsis sp. SIO1G2]
MPSFVSFLTFIHCTLATAVSFHTPVQLYPFPTRPCRTGCSASKRPFAGGQTAVATAKDGGRFYDCCRLKSCHISYSWRFLARGCFVDKQGRLRRFQVEAIFSNRS